MESRPDDDRYRFFDAGTAATFRAAADCIVPAEPGSAGAGCEQAVRVADAMLARRAAPDRRKFAAFLRALELLPVVRYGRRFSSLSPELRSRVLAFLSATGIHPLLRVGAFGVKTYALMGYYGSELAWTEMHYPGPRPDRPTREGQTAP
jgi:hypothetical protein